MLDLSFLSDYSDSGNEKLIQKDFLKNNYSQFSEVELDFLE
jgi:hypothetical protein